MKVNDPNLTPPGAAETGASRAQEAARTARTSAAGAGAGVGGAAVSGDDVHLSELVQSLRALAADSPERQAHIENIARAYAQGNYNADPLKTADGVIRDAIKPGVVSQTPLAKPDALGSR